MSDEEVLEIVNNLPEQYDLQGDAIEVSIERKDNKIIVLRKTEEDYQEITIDGDDVSVKSKEELEKEASDLSEENKEEEPTSVITEPPTEKEEPLADEEETSSGGGGGTKKSPPMLTADNFLDLVGNIGNSQNFVYQNFYAAMKTIEGTRDTFNQMGSKLSVETDGLKLDLSDIKNCKKCVGKACGVGASQNMDSLVSTFHAINEVVIGINADAKLYYDYNESLYAGEDFGEFATNNNLTEAEAQTIQKMCEEAMKQNTEKMDELYDQIDVLAKERAVFQEIVSTFVSAGIPYDENSGYVLSLDALLNYVDITYPEQADLLKKAIKALPHNGDNIKVDDYNNSIMSSYDTKMAEAYSDVLTLRTTYNLNLGGYCNMFQYYEDFDENSSTRLSYEKIMNNEGNPLDNSLFFVSSGETANAFYSYLDYASEDQLKIVQYMSNTGQGSQYLKQYLGVLEDQGNQIVAAKEFEEFVTDYYKRTNILLDDYGNPVRDDNGNLQYNPAVQDISPGIMGNTHTRESLGLDTIAWEGLGDGLQQFSDGIDALVKSKDNIFVTGESTYKQAMIINFLNDLYGGEGIKKALSTGTYEISSSIGNMVPSLATSLVAGALFTPMVGSVVGSTLLGASAAGNAMVEGYNAGAPASTAKMYGILTGLSEGGLQYALGGIPGLSMPREGVSFLHNILSEGLEESLQEIIGVGLMNSMLGYKAAEVNPKQVLKAGLYGMITAGLLDGSARAINGSIVLANGLVMDESGLVRLPNGEMKTMSEINAMLSEISEALEKGATEESKKNTQSLKEELISKITPDMSQLDIARLLYIELGRKVDYSESYKFATKNGITDLYEALYNKKMTVDQLFEDNSIICVNWAQLYSEILEAAGFKKENIVIQRLKENIEIQGIDDSENKFAYDSHAGIYIILDDGSVIMPDLTAPLGPNGDFYNVKVNNPTTGFVYFTKDQVELLAKEWESYSIDDLDYTVVNKDFNGDDIVLTDVFDNFVRTSAAYLYGMQFASKTDANTIGKIVGLNFVPDANAATEIKNYLEARGLDPKNPANKKMAMKELGYLTAKDARIASETVFYNYFKDKNQDILAETDENIKDALSVSDFFLHEITADTRFNQAVVDKAMLEDKALLPSFLGLDNVNNQNKITILAYINEEIAREKIGHKDGANEEGVKVKVEKNFVSADGMDLIISLYENGKKTGIKYAVVINENGAIDLELIGG